MARISIVKNAITALALLFVSVSAKAADISPISILGMEYTGSVQADQQGAFDMMLQDMLKQLNLPYRYDVVNAARGYRLFTLQKADCLLPSVNYPAYFEGLDVIHSLSFAKARQIAFSKNAEVITQPAQLQHKVVGIIRDEGTWDYTMRVPFDNITWVGVNNLETLANMLEKGRIDVAIHDREDYLNYVQQQGLTPPNYSGEHSMWEDSVVITCHNTPDNQAFMQQLKPLIENVNKAHKLIDYYRQVMERATQQQP